MASSLGRQKREGHGHGTASLEKPFSSTSSSSSSSSTMTMSNIPIDLLTKVFYKLPVKTLMKVICVSKTWFSVISSSHFIKTHLTLNKSNQISWYFNAHTSLDEIQMKSKDGVRSFLLNSPHNFDRRRRWRIAGSCNGVLLCVAGSGLGYDYELWNPCINKKMRIPKPQKPKLGGGQVVVGLGYDAVEKDFKLVRVSTVVELYTLSTRTWRTLSTSGLFAFSDVEYTGLAVNVNGCPHWLLSKNCIVCFNMTVEKFQKMEMPDDYSIADEQYLQLTVCDGLLSFVYRKWRRWSMTLWVMKEYGQKESWTKFAMIDPLKFSPYVADPLSYLPYTSSVALLNEVYVKPNKRKRR